MKINSYNLGMESTSTYSQKTTYTLRSETGRIGNSANNLGGFAGLFDTDVNYNQDGTTESKDGSQTSNVTKSLGGAGLDDLFRSMQGSVKGISTPNTVREIDKSDILSTMDKFRQQLIKYLEELFNKCKKKSEENDVCNSYTEDGPDGNYEYITLMESYTFEETQTYSFSSVGSVLTEDGREINFNLQFGMSQSFYSHYGSVIQQVVNTCDPLVINLDGDVAEVSDQKFFFDLDCDGKEDEISYFGKGTGMLAIDKNNDGIINDGSELFGTHSGDGFMDLSEYDEDHNGWIDENDSAWELIKIWCKNEDGTDELYSLKDKGVGALCLQRAGADYEYINQDRKSDGRLRSSGVFLYENGEVGSLQQIDLTT